MFVAFELAFEADDSGADGAEVRIASGLAWLGKFEAGDFAAQLEGHVAAGIPFRTSQQLPWLGLPIGH